MRNSLLVALSALVISWASAQAADSLTRFSAKAGPDMKVRIEGTSTVHDWQVQGHLIGGSLEVGPNFPTEPGQSVTPGKVEAEATVYIPVRSLKSVEKDGSPYSDKMDEVMYDHLKQAQFQRITFHLTELTLKTPAAAKDAPYLYDAKGDLVVAGVTNNIAMPIKVLPLGNKKLRVSGETSVKMTDFGVKPPVLIGLLSTGDPVKLSFEWPLEERGAAPK